MLVVYAVDRRYRDLHAELACGTLQVAGASESGVTSCAETLSA